MGDIPKPSSFIDGYYTPTAEYEQGIALAVVMMGICHPLS
jgi:hypothetical protein